MKKFSLLIWAPPLVVIGFLSIFVLAIRLLPFPALKTFQNRRYSAEIYDRNEKMLSILPLEQGLRRQFRSLEEIAPEMIHAFLSAEDRRFFLHPGTDLGAIVRALFQRVRYGRAVSGASTVSMQVARMLRENHKSEPILLRKSREIINALRIESRVNKKGILELWLNNLPFAFQVEGVASASYQFFGVSPEKLSREQIAALVKIPRNPSLYSPTNTQERGRWPFLAPHFIQYVSPLVVKTGHHRVITSIDADSQRRLESLVKHYLSTVVNNRIHNAAALLFHNGTGEIYAYVGSQNFDDLEYSGQIDGVLAKNQPGSALKPFLYALALESGFLPSDLLPDEPLDFGGEEVYTPRNFDGRYRGPVRLRTALAASLNVPAVYVLEQIGVREFQTFLERLGVLSAKSVHSEGPGVGLALGNTPVNLYELTRAFGMFPRNGQNLTLNWRKQNSPMSGEQLISRYASGTIIDILADSAERYAGFGHTSFFPKDKRVMLKTGTADQFQSIWALAATPDFTVGVWMGNFSGETVVGETGSSVPAQIAIETLSALGNPERRFSPPDGAKSVTICSLSGRIAGSRCPHSTREYIPRGRTLGRCSVHDRGQAAESLLVGNSPGLHIEYPNDGAVFFLDPSVDPDVQAIAIRVSIDGYSSVTQSISILVNGQNKHLKIHEPGYWLFPIEKGNWKIEARSPDMFDSVTITVQ